MLLFPAVAHADGCYVVQPNDTLSEISLRWDVSWTKVAAYNNLSNPHLIFPGQVICWEARDIASYALAQLGKPYVWAGVGPKGYDCSGLVSAAYAEHGIYVPHNAYLQYIRSNPVSVPHRNDLAFYNKGSSIVHVGIMINDTMLVHATSRYGKVVVESPWAYRNLYSFGRIQ